MYYIEAKRVGYPIFKQVQYLLPPASAKCRAGYGVKIFTVHFTHANLVYQVANFSRKYITLWMLIYEICVE